MKEKRKRIPARRKIRGRFLRFVLIIAAVVTTVLLLAFVCLAYVTIQVGEHEYRRKLRYVGIDPDLEIAQTIDDVLPAARLKYKFLKSNLLSAVSDDAVAAHVLDSFNVFRPHLVNCLRGRFEIFVSGQEEFDDVVRRIAGFAVDIGLRHYAEHDDRNPHPDPFVKELHTFRGRLGMREEPYRRIYLTWAGIERDPSTPSFAPTTSRYRLGFDFSDLGCFWP